MTVFHSSCVYGRIVRLVTGPGLDRFVELESIDTGANVAIVVGGDDGRLVSDKLSSLREMRWPISVEYLANYGLEQYDCLNHACLCTVDPQ